MIFFLCGGYMKLPILLLGIFIFQGSPIYAETEGVNRCLHTISASAGDDSWEAALEVCREECEQNDRKSCAVLGGAYRFGRNVEKDIMQSVKYYEKACELNTSRTGACTELGTIYYLGRRPDSKGVGIEADPVKAKEYFKKAASLKM